MTKFKLGEKEYEFSYSGVRQAHADLISRKGQFTLMSKEAKHALLHDIKEFLKIMQKLLYYEILIGRQLDDVLYYMKYWKNVA